MNQKCKRDKNNAKKLYKFNNSSKSSEKSTKI